MEGEHVEFELDDDPTETMEENPNEGEEGAGFNEEEFNEANDGEDNPEEGGIPKLTEEEADREFNQQLEQEDEREREDDDIAPVIELEGSDETIYRTVRKEDRRTAPIFSKYEKARLIGIRMTELENGFPAMVNYRNYGFKDKPPYIDKDYPFDYEEIVHDEIDQKVCPLYINRYIPNRKIEVWRLDELFDPYEGLPK